MEFITVLIIGIIIMAIYFLPAFVANDKKHPQAGAISVLNFFLGWTLIGWVVALAWACTNQEQKEVIAQSPEKKSSVDELEKLAELKEKGILTTEEFEAKKKQILGLEN